MLYQTVVSLGLATIALALPTDKESKGLAASKFIIALKSTAKVDLDLHARWVSDVHRQALARRGVESSGIDKTFSFPGFKGYSGSFDEDTIEIIKANSSVSRYTFPDWCHELTWNRSCMLSLSRLLLSLHL